MRIIHFCSWLNKISGLVNSVKEIVEAEIELGFEAGICDPLKPKGGYAVKLRRTEIKTLPITEAFKKDAVSFISTPVPHFLEKLPHKVGVNHAMAEYAFIHQFFTSEGKSFESAVSTNRLCDVSICWSSYEAEFWKIMFPKKKFYVVPHGVDLKYWSPKESNFFKFHPVILYAESPRLTKIPFTEFFAVKKFSNETAESLASFFVIGILPEDKRLKTYPLPHYTFLIAKLNLDPKITIYPPAQDIRHVFRSADICLSPVSHGLTSRVAIESLALGVPTLILKGQKDSYASVKCENSPEAMAEALVNLWEKIKKNPKRMRKETRRIAEKHYDVRQTARQFVEIAEGVL